MTREEVAVDIRRRPGIGCSATVVERTAAAEEGPVRREMRVRVSVRERER